MGNIATRAGAISQGNLSIEVLEPEVGEGTTITIDQLPVSDFSTATNTLSIDGISATPTAVNPFRLTATVPSGVNSGSRVVSVQSGAFNASTTVNIVDSKGAIVALSYQSAFNATGQTLSTIEYNAIRDFVNAIEGQNGLTWDANIFAFYPHLGTTHATQRINCASPGTGDLVNTSGTITYSASAGASINGGTMYPGGSFIGSHWSASNFRGWLLGIGNFPVGQTNFGTPRPISGLEGANTSYLLSDSDVRLLAHTNANSVDPTVALGSSFSGRVGCFSIASSSNAIDRGYINGVAQPASVAGAKFTSTDFRILTSNSIPSPSGSSAIIKGWLMTKSVAGLTATQITTIDSAFAGFLSAIGRG